MTLDYLLTLGNGKTEKWNGADFNEWVKEQGERVGGTFQARLDQFRRYTGMNVKDWEMVDL